MLKKSYFWVKNTIFEHCCQHGCHIFTLEPCWFFYSQGRCQFLSLESLEGHRLVGLIFCMHLKLLGNNRQGGPTVMMKWDRWQVSFFLKCCILLKSSKRSTLLPFRVFKLVVTIPSSPFLPCLQEWGEVNVEGTLWTQDGRRKLRFWAFI